MEIISVSYVNDKKHENLINLKDNLINCIIDYGNINNLVVEGKNYILIDDIKKSFKTNNFGNELEYYRKITSETYINQILKIFEFNEEIYKKNINIMSSSELRLIYIFINLLFNEKLIILNKVTKDLDVKNTKKVISIIKELKKQNKTIVVITDDVEFIHKIADNVIVLKEKIICYGDKYEVFVNNNLKKEPNVIKFSKLVKDKKNIKIGYRDDIKDLMKDIYRCVK